jgi:hypothetical protein
MNNDISKNKDVMMEGLRALHLKHEGKKSLQRPTQVGKVVLKIITGVRV